MKDELKHYRGTPLGEQLGVHLAQRAALRRDVPLFSFSLSAIVKRFEEDAAPRDGELQHI